MAFEDETAIQRRYYVETAGLYDEMHDGEEHRFALAAMIGMVDHLGIRSVLDVGAGTGRTVRALMAARPGLHVRGIEPVKELRDRAAAQGLSPDVIVDGDACAMRFADGEFDLACCFAVLHHIRTPGLAIAEMLRVARTAIFISDANNFGQGGTATRWVKQTLDFFGLWPAANFLKTRGRGYSISEGDGLAYSFSVFNHYDDIRSRCKSVHVMNTIDSGHNLYRCASSVALLGIKS